MIQAEVLRPHQLRPEDRAAWADMCGEGSPFANPLLGPNFADLVGSVRDDVRIAVFRRDTRPAGFLPYHRAAGGYARPIGAPFSDYHALVTAPDPGFAGKDALAAADISRFGHQALLDPYCLFPGGALSHREAYVIDLRNTDPAAHLEAIRKDSPKRVKNWRRLEHKMEREHGPVGVLAPDGDEATLRQLMAWKSAQLRRSGLHDVLRPSWVQALMTRLFRMEDASFRGMLITLTAGGRPVAAQFGIRAGGIFHPWLAGYDPAVASVGPGITFLRRAIESMPDLGLEVYDLSAGHGEYKGHFASRTVSVSEGVAAAATEGAPSRALSGVLRVPRESLAGRLRGRLEQIAAVEPSGLGRARGVLWAVSDASKRLSRPDPSESGVV